MEIKVIGTGCDKCDKLYKNVQAAVDELGIEANVEKVEDLLEIVQLGVMSSPSLMVNGNLVVNGVAASKKQIIKILNKENGKIHFI